ncbi:MAG: YwqG family protein, partial [Defluviitaleaceae bacterium]|nr:YwqG family protein [Defluviitaleaceae bacterium]
MENLTQLLEDFKAETKQPAIRLTTRQSDQITATNSKFGGLPYLPKNFAYPMDGKGNPLKLLAQLNFGELPPLADFPSEGILQFFVLNNKMLGVKDWKNQSKVLYHEKILPESEQMTDFPEVKYISEDDEELEFPFEGEFLITGELVEMSMPYDYGDGGFFDNFKPFCEKHGIMSHFEKIFLTGEDWKNLSESEE